MDRLKVNCQLLATLLLLVHPNLGYTGSGYDQTKTQILIDGKWTEIGGRFHTASPRPFPGFTLPTGFGTIQKVAEDFLWQHATVFGQLNRADFELQKVVAGEHLTSVRFKRFHTVNIKGSSTSLEVKGDEALVHLTGTSISFATANNGYISSGLLEYKLDRESAESIAIANYGTDAWRIEKSGLIIVRNPTSEDKEHHLAWSVKVRDQNGIEAMTYYVDAKDGHEIYAVTNMRTKRKRLVLLGQGNAEDRDDFVSLIEHNEENPDDLQQVESKFRIGYSEIGCNPNRFREPSNRRTDLNRLPRPCRRIFDEKVQEAAEDAWKNSGMVYEYYSSKFGRDSFDENGAITRSLVHFMPNWQNAAWVDDLGVMIYGDGDGDRFHGFAKALDVAAHEMTHAVTSRTSNMEYVYESGALNESYSDVFGKLISFEFEGFENWKLGGKIFKDPTQFIRDMENPTIGHVDDFIHRGVECDDSNDGCGVHTNSGIPNRAAVAIANSIGFEATGKIYYHTLTQLLRPSSDFKDARLQTLISCELAFGENSAQCAQVEAGFSLVGIE